MEINSKKKKDALNASESQRSSRAGSSTATNVSSMVSESQATDQSLSSLSQSEVVYNSSIVSSSGQDMMGGYNLRAHLQRIMQFSDEMESSSDDDYSVESFDDEGAEAELQRIVGKDQGEGHDRNITPKPTNQTSNALVAVEEEDEDLDSEEENAIMKEIKEEIKNNVRQEMKSELELYKKKAESLEKGMGDGERAEDKSNADLDNLDPKLKEAFIKMRKLDKVLSKRVRREKEVKRDRILLERRIRQELKDLHAEGKQEYKEIENNEQKFLALELPSRHNEELINDENMSAEEENFPSEKLMAIDMKSYTDVLKETNFYNDDMKHIELDSVHSCHSIELDDLKNDCFVATIESQYKDLPHSFDINKLDKDHNFDTDCKDIAKSKMNFHSKVNKDPFVSQSHSVDTKEIIKDASYKTDSRDIAIATIHSQSKINKSPFLETWLIDNMESNVAGNENGIEPQDGEDIMAWKSVTAKDLFECWGSESDIRGVIVPDAVTGEPVFATQLDEDSYPGMNNNSSRAGRQGTRSTRAGSQASSNAGTEKSGSTRDDTSSVASGSVDSKHHKKKRKKDFIKRNKELASDAGNVIAMTEEEKKRLDDLLKDVDNIPDIPEVQEDVEDDSNPFQIAVPAGEGFHPDLDEMRSMTSIDARLRELMPPEDYESVAYSSMSNIPKNKLFTRTAARSEVEWENHGERALFQNAEQRDMNDRLRAIEEELNKLHNPDEIEIDTPTLDDDQLHDLIDQCVTSLSRTSLSRTSYNTDSRFSFADTESLVEAPHSIDGTVDNTPRTPASVRQELLENPPRLAPEVLQKLLSEAYHPLSKQLTTLREEDCEDEDGTPIPADVWKLISMEKVDESPDSSHNIETDNKENINSRQNTYDELQKSSSRQNSHENFQNPQSARNGFRNLSRNSSSSSLNGANIDRDSKPLKLPEIDPTGTLITQGLSNQRPPSNNQRPPSNNQRPSSSNSVKTPVSMVRHSFGDVDSSQPNSRMEIMSFDGDFMSPRPPSGEKRETGSASKSRTVTPVHRPIT